jgi:peptidyl-tRNA hydrolase, PTH1 family
MLFRIENLAYLIVGLGNPGREYRNTRHNAGFMVLDRLAERLGESFSRYEMRALVTKSQYQQNRLILAKPQTFMNESGQAVGGLVRFYKVPVSQLMVVYDDVDLPLGSLRIRPSGGSAGQKGMQSIIQKLSVEDFPRMRIGIGRPPGRMDTTAYVLQEFTRSESVQLPAIFDRAVDAILAFVVEGLEKAMTQYNNSGVA